MLTHSEAGFWRGSFSQWGQMRLRVTIYLQNDTEVSGLYSLREAGLWLMKASKQPDYKDFKLEVVYERA